MYLHDITQSATSLIPIRHVGFINSTTITANIRGSSDGKTPPGNVPVGSYDLIVVNPDGSGSTLAYNFATGYTETTGCPPQITSVSPNQLPSGSTSTVTIDGQNFTTGATVSFVPQTGAPLPMTVVSVSSESIHLSGARL